MRTLRGRDDAGQALDVQDPQKALLLGALRPGDPRPFLALEPVFGTDLGRAPAFVAAVAEALRRLETLGVRAAMGSY